MAARHVITPEVLRQLIRYDPRTGKFVWLRRDIEWFGGTPVYSAERCHKTWNSKHADKPAFDTLRSDGYYFGRVLDQGILAHIVAWAIETGDFPKCQIDHEDGNRGNNVFKNLRDVSRPDQMRNLKLFSTNASGRVGVSWGKRDRRWFACISVNDRTVHLGSYVVFEDAVKAREAAELKYGFHPNHGNR